jgi:hypothetical protein
MSTIYTATCARCGRDEYAHHPIPDGTHVQHTRSEHDYNGLTVMSDCNGVFVSRNMRTLNEIVQIKQQFES